MKKVKKLGLVALCLSLVVSTVVALGFTGEQTNFVDDNAVVAVAVLKRGASGGEVKEVQRRLKQWGYYKGSLDGIYGTKTIEAVKLFQRKNGLKVDGITGKATYAALGMNDSVKALEGGKNNSSSGGSSYTNSDLYLLAKCIHAEARGEVYTGQVAVGAVILNRVKSPQFPNTIAGVIYQKGAFTAVDDGQINLEPNQTAYNAARDALNGWDPTYGCIYYYNPATATSAWIFERQTVTTIGKHVFAI